MGRVLPRIYLSVFCPKPHLSVGKGNRNDQASRRPVGRHVLSQGHAGTTRLLAEAARSAPAHLSPHEHAWDVFLTATFENGLLPGIRLDSVREDPPNSFQEARIRAKKHEAKQSQRCFHPHPPYCIRCRAFWTSSAAKHGLIQYCYHQRSSRGNIQSQVGGETAHEPYYEPRRTNQAG